MYVWYIRHTTGNVQQVLCRKLREGWKFIQPCKWGGTWDLWLGRVSDSEYHERCGYLQAQKEYQENNLVPVSAEYPEVKEVVPLTILLDKGYRSRATNWRCGKQRTVQPVYGKSDQKFKGRDTIFSGAVASYRSGNEREVNVTKICGFIRKGFSIQMDPRVFNNV